MPYWSARRNSGSPVVEELYLKRLYRGLHGSLLRPVPAPLLINRTRTGAGSQVLHGSLKITRSRDQHRTIIQQIDACWALVRQQTSEQNGVLLGPSPAPTTLFAPRPRGHSVRFHRLHSAARPPALVAPPGARGGRRAGGRIVSSANLEGNPRGAASPRLSPPTAVAQRRRPTCGRGRSRQRRPPPPPAADGPSPAGVPAGWPP